MGFHKAVFPELVPTSLFCPGFLVQGMKKKIMMILMMKMNEKVESYNDDG